MGNCTSLDVHGICSCLVDLTKELPTTSHHQLCSTCRMAELFAARMHLQLLGCLADLFEANVDGMSWDGGQRSICVHVT